MGMRLDPDETSENRARAIAQRILVEQITRRMWRTMILQGAGVEFLFVVGDRKREQITPRPFADESAQTFKSRIGSAEIEIQTHRRSVALHRGGVDLQGNDVFIPPLRTDVFHRRSSAGDEIVYPAGKSAPGFLNRTEMFDHRNFRHLVSDQQQMRKNGGVFVRQPMENFDRQFEFDAAGDVNKRSGADMGAV